MAMLYDLGLVCGRMQHIHIGHQHIIDMGLMTCDRVLIMLGSAQESRTQRNPFTYDERKQLLEMIYAKECKNGRIIIKPLCDMSKDPETSISPAWGKYVLSHITTAVEKTPDVMLYGNDEARSKWFDKEDIKDMMEIIIPRTRIDISATKVRDFIVRDSFVAWSKFAPQPIHSEFNRLRTILAEAEYYDKLIHEEDFSKL